MTPRGLLRVLAIYLVAVVALFASLRAYVKLGPREPVTVRSRWRSGALIGRTVLSGAEAGPGESNRPNEANETHEAGVTVVDAVAVEEGPLSARPWLFALALVPGREGVRAELGAKTAWVTVDDLLAEQAYDRGVTFGDASLGIGTQRAVVVALLATRLDATPRQIERGARLRRVRFERRVRTVASTALKTQAAPAAPAPRVTGATLSRELVTDAVREAAEYLARGVDASGRFRYLVLATRDLALPQYNWPRHAGATYFLAQAASLLDEPNIRYAALRAAARLRDDTMVACGANRCIADDDEADVGSSALAAIAFAELVRTGADASYRRSVAELAAFLRAQQRPDGELMHLYDRPAQKPRDVQLLYFTGEAALALARAHEVTGDPADLEAARRALAHLVGPGWTFFGSRYYFGEEHWTCQAMADLWTRAPSEEALAFCLRWHAFQRAMQHEDGDSPFDADGAFGVGPFLTPRVTPASSRGEAAGATLEVLRAKGPTGAASTAGATEALAEEARALDDELRRAIAFVLRAQLRPGPTWLFADPAAVRGAMPGSPVDLQLRIDYPQHAGSMMIRWLALTAPGG